MIIILVILVSPLLVFFLLFLYIRFLRCSKRIEVKTEPREVIELTRSNVFSIWNYDGRMVFEDIIEATENFNHTYCVGVGANGNVYKAELQTGQVLAVKRFHQPGNDEVLNDKQFQK